ncbi:hypothetical protein COOONC_20270 [Cooperia oncophora]
MCSDALKYLDRICDVEGIPVTDKELTKKQIIKGLKANGKVSMAVERPVTKERKEKVERLLSMIEHQPASVMLEPDVIDILVRYNARLKAQKPPKAHSALAKKGARDNVHQACVKSKIESVHIGMDNELLQEDLEKVPIKTYETSLARLQNQDQKDPNSLCITEMIQTDGVPNPPPPV